MAETYTVPSAAYAARTEIRSFRHLVDCGYGDDGRPAGAWHRLNASGVVVLAVAARLQRYGLAPTGALAIAIEAVEPLLTPAPEFNIAGWLIPQTLEGKSLTVWPTVTGFAYQLDDGAGWTEGLRIDLHRLALDVVARLAGRVMIAPTKGTLRLKNSPPASDVSSGHTVSEDQHGTAAMRVKNVGQPAPFTTTNAGAPLAWSATP